VTTKQDCASSFGLIFIFTYSAKHTVKCKWRCKL